MAKVRLFNGKPLMVSGKVALSDDCCCGGIDCSFIPTKITFTGVTFPGCCLTEGGLWFKFTACSPVTGNCYDINQVAGWPLTPFGVNQYIFNSGFSDYIVIESDYTDPDCTDFVFDNTGSNFGIVVTCDPVTGWTVQMGESYKYFAAIGITNPTVPFPNACTCGGSPPPIIGRCSAAGGTAVLS